MTKKIIHIAPFDIGNSFFDYEYNKKNPRESFINKLTLLCTENGYGIIHDNNPNNLLYVRISDNISCRILKCGIGVFVLTNIEIPKMESLSDALNKHVACELYRRKKYEQNIILQQDLSQIKVMSNFMKLVWKSVDKVIRPFSSNEKYKHNGLSYVLSIYHIIDEHNELTNPECKELSLLMNPEILSNILDKEQWNTIDKKISFFTNKEYLLNEYNDTTNIAASWSAVAIIESKSSSVIKKIVDYEIMLQASWFLFDCLIDNIKNTQMTNISLQKEKSLASNMSLEVSNILSANISSNEKKALESIYATSGFETLKDKLFLLLENRIAIEEARISHRQGIYGIISEILLVLFTLVSIYEPIKNLFNGTLSATDIIVGIIMLIVLVICSILIIGKEKL